MAFLLQIRLHEKDLFSKTKFKQSSIDGEIYLVIIILAIPH